MFRKEITSLLAVCHARPLSKSKLEVLVFLEGGKEEYPEKIPVAMRKTQLSYDTKRESNLGHLDKPLTTIHGVNTLLL